MEVILPSRSWCRFYVILTLFQMNLSMRKRNIRTLPTRWTKHSPSFLVSKLLVAELLSVGGWNVEIVQSLTAWKSDRFSTPYTALGYARIVELSDLCHVWHCFATMSGVLKMAHFLPVSCYTTLAFHPYFAITTPQSHLSGHWNPWMSVFFSKNFVWVVCMG